VTHRLTATTTAAILVIAAAVAFADEGPTVRMVDVDQGVQLETLDWGGRGPDVVLLAGMGLSAHVYDGFARRLAADYRVVGVTRRGFGASTHANGGYDPLTLARDVRRACDALGIEQPILVGHSLAGTEMAFFASRYPGRARGMVFLDAAYDHSLLEELEGLAPRPAVSAPGADDLRTPDAMLEWFRRTRGFLLPESELRSLYVFTEDGRLKDLNASPLAQGLIMDALTPPPFGRVKAPALAIFTKPTLASQYPEHDDFAPDVLRAARRRVSVSRQLMSAALATFEALCPQAETVILDGANHYLFLTRPTAVLQAVRAFLVSLPAPTAQP